MSLVQTASSLFLMARLQGHQLQGFPCTFRRDLGQGTYMKLLM